MNNIFVTSDLFLGKHSKALSLGFNSVDIMNSTIIENWNKIVKPNDIVYVLGNFFWDPITYAEIMPKLNGIIRLLKGEFDKSVLDSDLAFSNIQILNNDIIYVKLNEIEYILSHYPLEDWKNKKNGSIHLHGSSKEIKSNLNKLNRFNIMNELWNFTPVNIYEFIELIKDYKQAKIKK